MQEYLLSCTHIRSHINTLILINFQNKIEKLEKSVTQQKQLYDDSEKEVEEMRVD